MYLLNSSWEIEKELLSADSINTTALSCKNKKIPNATNAIDNDIKGIELIIVAGMA